MAGSAGFAVLSPASAVNAAGGANYDPKVGGAAAVALGYHFNSWISAQAGLDWNRHRTIFNQLRGSNFSSTERDQTVQTIFVDALLYFRNRNDRFRPYLSAGPALVTFPQAGADRHELGLKVTVGIDVRIKDQWSFRYSFHETMSANPLAASLQPPSPARLMNFQNLFGIVRSF